MHLMRILVTQFVQDEPASIRDLLCPVDGVGMAGKQPDHFRRRLQMPHSGPFPPMAEFVDRAAFTDAGQHILQDAPPGAWYSTSLVATAGTPAARARSAIVRSRTASLGRCINVSAT